MGKKKKSTKSNKTRERLIDALVEILIGLILLAISKIVE